MLSVQAVELIRFIVYSLFYYISTF